MSKMNEDAYENKRALPNKMLNEDGSITDLLGNPVVPMNEAYKKRPALPNKWLNADGTYSTLQEILGGAIDTDIFIVVEELPQTGEENKIYLVPDGEGGFDEYHYIDGKWDPVGAIDMGVNPQIFYWDGNTQQTGLDFWNNIYQLQKTQSCLVYTRYKWSNKDILQKWYYHNDMPTSLWESNVVNSTYIPGDLSTMDSSYSRLHIFKSALFFTIADDIVTEINFSKYSPTVLDFLALAGYSNPYIPQNDGSPATKKYVDDSIASAITDAIGGEY